MGDELTIEQCEELEAAAAVGMLRPEDRGRYAQALLILANRDKSEAEAVETNQRTEPRDIDGNIVVAGKWYWAMDRTGRIVGTGKIMFYIGSGGTPTWFINGAGYSPEGFKFVRAVDPDFDPDGTEANLSRHISGNPGQL